MTEVPIPDNYHSLADLSKWLRENMPDEEHWGNVWRWKITSDPYRIQFVNPADATLFTLKWPR